MGRPTIALAMIVKNEEKNIGGLFESIRGCFDEIHICDTGSTDSTVSEVTRMGAQNGEKVIIKNFPWVNDINNAMSLSI